MILERFEDMGADQLRALLSKSSASHIHAAVRRRLSEVEAAPTSAAAAPQAPPATARPATHRRGEPNGTERRYERDWLQGLLELGEITRYAFEGVGFWLPGLGRRRKEGSAGPALYTPDWACWTPSGALWVHEVKGAQMWEKDRVRFLASAERNPEVRHTLRQWKADLWTTLYDLNARSR